MKRYEVSVLIIVLVIILSVSVAFSKPPSFDIIQLTDNTVGDGAPHINNSGDVAWSGQVLYNGTLYSQIFVYNGTNVTQISNSPIDHVCPQLNDSGQIAMNVDGGSSNRYLALFNGTSIANIGYYAGYYPRINNNGWVVSSYLYDIYLYNGVSSYQITNSTPWDRYPVINNNNEIAWLDTTNGDIYTYDGSSINLITNSTGPGFGYMGCSGTDIMNDNGEIVWMEHDGNDLEIYMYNGTGVVQITDNSYDDRDPQINAQGHVVWQSYGNWDYRGEIYFYDGTNITQITSDSKADEYPMLNDNDEIVWMHMDNSDLEIYYTDGSNTAQLTKNQYNDTYPVINNAGQIVWTGFDGVDYEIFFVNGVTF